MGWWGDILPACGGLRAAPKLLAPALHLVSEPLFWAARLALLALTSSGTFGIASEMTRHVGSLGYRREIDMNVKRWRLRETYPGRLVGLLGGAIALIEGFWQKGPTTWVSWPFAIAGAVLGGGWSLLAWRREHSSSRWRPSPLHGIGLLFAGIVVVYLGQAGPMLRPTCFAASGFLFAMALLLPPRVFRTVQELRQEKDRRGGRGQNPLPPQVPRSR
jgi:hypothetical protein